MTVRQRGYLDAVRGYLNPKLHPCSFTQISGHHKLLEAMLHQLAPMHRKPEGSVLARSTPPEHEPDGGWGRTFSAASDRQGAQRSQNMSTSSMGSVPANEEWFIQSLDQLFAQALGLAPLLLDKCHAIARLCGALEQRPARPTGVRANQAVLDHWLGPVVGNNSVIHDLVDRGLVKCPARAISKAILCYGADVSRLLDVCRTRLIVATLDGLLVALRALIHDPVVVIHRIKNLMAPPPPAGGGFGFDPAWSAGFRVRHHPRSVWGPFRV